MCQTSSGNGSILTDQFVENIVIKCDAFPRAAAFDILHEIGQGIILTTDRNIPDFMHDFLKALFLGDSPDELENIPCLRQWLYWKSSDNSSVPRKKDLKTENGPIQSENGEKRNEKDKASP